MYRYICSYIVTEMEIDELYIVKLIVQGQCF